jgi:hypothetical protein
VVQGGETADRFEIAPETYDTHYERLVQPRRAVMLPGYFFRWVALLGPALAWLYVAFYEAAWLTGGRSGVYRGAFSGKQIARWCGISLRTFSSRINRPATWEALRGLVWRETEAPQYRKSRKGHPVRQPNRYRVAMTLPLTPTDTARLTISLAKLQAQYGDAEAALQAAVHLPREALLDEIGARFDGEAKTIRQVVDEVFGSHLTAQRLASLVSALQEHLSPEHDRIRITLFFLERVLPHLRQAAAWILVYLQDHCWMAEGDEARDHTIIRGGYAELARLVGLNRPKTVWEILREPVMRMYVREIPLAEASRAGKWHMPRRFQVLLRDVPLELIARMDDEAPGFPDDAPFHCGVSRFEPEMRNTLEDFGGAVFHPGAVRSPEPGGANFHHGVARFSQPGGANFHHRVARFSQSGGANFAILKPLSPGLSPESPDNPEVDSSEDQGKGPPPSQQAGGGWDWEMLFAANSEIPLRERAQVRQANPADFVLWLLYAYSSQGKGIRTPALFALRRVQEGQPPPAAFRPLAQYTPADLAQILAYPTAGTRWEKLLPNSAQKRTELTRRLLDRSTKRRDKRPSVY